MGMYWLKFLNLGYTRAAQKCGLLDCVSYFTASSGSTWFLISWLESGWLDFNKYLKEFYIRASTDSLA